MHHVALAITALLAFTAAAAAQSASPAATTRAAATSASGAQSPPIHPGTYLLEITYGGGTLDGSLELTRAGDSLAVKLQVGEHASPIRSVVRKGSRLTLLGGAEGMPLAYELEFSGDSVSGTFTYAGTDGSVAGKRRK